MKKVLGFIITIGIISGSLIGCESAEFEVSPVETPEYVLTGMPVTVDFEVANVGNADGIYSASLKLDGIEIESSETTVAVGASEEISFTFDIDEPGMHTLDINGMIAEVTAIDPEEIVTRVKEASREVKTIRANMVMSMSMEMSQKDEEYKTEMSIDSNFTIDNENREASIDMDMAMRVPGTGSVEGTTETYLVNDTLYIRTNIAGKDSGWQKTESAAEKWSEYQVVDTQLGIAEFAVIEFLRMEIIDGENCLVFKIIPDKEDVIDTIMSHQQMNQALGEDSDDFTSLISGLFGQMLEFEMEMCISEDTFLIKKTTISGGIDLAVLAGFKMDIEIELRDLTYNESVTIELPVEAQGF